MRRHRNRGWWWRELKEANKPARWPKYTEMALEMGCCPHFLTENLLKMPFFTQKYSIRHNPKMFFEKYINFKFFWYLGCCGVIPIQGFGSHIRPQQSGLGLRHCRVVPVQSFGSHIIPQPSVLEFTEMRN